MPPVANSDPKQALPTRFRFASGSAPSARTMGEVEETLRQRLRFGVTLFGAEWIVQALGALYRVQSGAAGAASYQLTRIAQLEMLLLPVLFWAIWRLRPGTAISMALLRRIEVVTMGCLVLTAVLTNLIDFPSIAAIIPVAPIDLGAGVSGQMGFTIVAYGVLIPNTWRRCLAMVSAMVVVSFIPDMYSLWKFQIDGDAAGTFLVSRAVVVATGAALAVFGSYRIELSDAAAREASQLGQYLLRERIGAGGMGEVYRAEHQFLRRPCAVKLIRPEHAGDAEVLKRFEREVQATAVLTHPNTVAIYDYGISEDGTFYYVMEYLPGDTLEGLVTREGPLAPARAVHLLRQVASALGEAHRAGLTHRDIKPGNVMVCERGGITDVAKLLDFGLVVTQGMQQADEKLTQAGIILGTPAYMSPEQCGGDAHPGPASDIYSVGALAYFMLTGRSPFEGKGPVQMMMAHLGEMPPSVRSLRPEVPEALDAVVMRSLAKRPEDRYASAEELERALSPIG